MPRLNRRRLAIKTALIVFLVAILSGVGLLVHASQGLPEVGDLRERLNSTSFIYNEDGSELIAALHDVEHRVIVDIERMPKHLKEAFISTEDERFYHHYGVDMRAMGRALLANISDRSMAQGGSTITQQLARNAYLSQEKILTRKIQEWFMAVKIERLYTKDDILGMYLNQVFLGYNAYGVEAASNLYFDKRVDDLTLAESALLAGITRSPNSLSPHHHLERAKARQETVLNQMVRNGYITTEEAEAAKAEELTIVPPTTKKYNYPYFVDYVLKELLDTYGAETVYRGGLKVYTTIDTTMQKEAEKAITEVLDAAFPPKDGVYEPQAALISVDPHTGYIKALVGGRHHELQMGLNRTIQPRQPGSAFKPVVVFAPAIASGYSPTTIIEDAPITLRVGNTNWSPRNYNHRYIGPVTLREASARSINTVAVRLIDDLGVDRAISSIQNLGITTLELSNPRTNDRGPAISLGGLTYGTSPMELNSAYGAFAAGGKLAEPLAILKVEDRNGVVLEEHKPKVKQVLDPGVAYLVTDMLKDTIERPYGTGHRNGNIGRPAAAKTGTTDDIRDAWFVGYTPDLVTTVWMGHDRDKTMTNVYGGNYPARIWNRTMRAGHQNIPKKDFAVPDNIVSLRVCAFSGLPLSEYCSASSARTGYFVAGTDPSHVCGTCAATAPKPDLDEQDDSQMKPGDTYGEPYDPDSHIDIEDPAPVDPSPVEPPKEEEEAPPSPPPDPPDDSEENGDNGVEGGEDREQNGSTEEQESP